MTWPAAVRAMHRTLLSTFGDREAAGASLGLFSYQLGDAAPVEVNGRYRSGTFQDQDAGGEVSVQRLQPEVTFIVEDLPGLPSEGEVLVRRPAPNQAQLYRVIDWDHDAEGLLLCFLSAVTSSEE